MAAVFGVVALPTLAHASDPAGLPVPPQGFDAKSSSIPHGKVEASIKYQTSKNGTQRFTIYTPPGYSAEQKYPVLYLFHGIGGDEKVWTSGSEGNADNVMDYLYSKNLAKPMIVIMPDGNVDGASDGFGAFTEVLINDLIPYVEKTYPALTDADSRAISGLSMGGGQTFNIGFPNVDKFHYIGPYSAAPNTQQPSQTIKDVAKLKAEVKLIFIACGTNDSLLSNSTMYHDFLDKNNVTHMYQLEQGGGHDKTVWNRSLYNFAQRIFQGTPGTGGTSGSDGGVGGSTGTGTGTTRRDGGANPADAGGGTTASGGNTGGNTSGQAGNTGTAGKGGTTSTSAASSGGSTSDKGGSSASSSSSSASGGSSAKSSSSSASGGSSAASSSSSASSSSGGSSGSSSSKSEGTSSATGDSGGCSCALDRTGHGGSAVLFLMALAALLRRRRSN